MPKLTLTSQETAHGITQGYIFATREDEPPGSAIEERLKPLFEGKLTIYRLAMSLIVLIAEEKQNPDLLDVRDKIERAFFMSDEGEALLPQVKVAMQSLNELLFSEEKRELSWASSCFEEFSTMEADPIELCLFSHDWMQQYIMVTNTVRDFVITG